MLGRVQVVDDDEREGIVLVDNLKVSVPCTAEWTDDPNATIAAAGKDQFDLFVVDLRMKDRDGLTVLAELKSRFPHCEVVMVTGYTDVPSAKAAMKLGAIDYCDREDNAGLVAAVSHALRRRPSRRAPGYHRESLIDYFRERLGAASRPVGTGAIPQGVALEYLVKLLLDSCGIFEMQGMRVTSSSEEVDVVMRVSAPDPFWGKQKSFVLVECKDKGTPIGADQRRNFEPKVLKRVAQCNIALFVSTGGFTKGFYEEAVPGQGVTIVPIDLALLDEWIAAADRLKWLTNVVASRALQ